MKHLLLLFGLSICLNTLGQQEATTDFYDRLGERFHYNTRTYDSTANESWAKNKRTITFDNQGDYHSTYIALNNDSTFIFLSIFEGGEFLSTGSWTMNNDSTYRFNWDKGKSVALCKDRKRYKKYYQYSHPVPLKISDWIFIRRQSKLLPTAVPQRKS